MQLPTMPINRRRIPILRRRVLRRHMLARILMDPEPVVLQVNAEREHFVHEGGRPSCEDKAGVAPEGDDVAEWMELGGAFVDCYGVAGAVAGYCGGEAGEACRLNISFLAGGGCV